MDYLSRGGPQISKLRNALTKINIELATAEAEREMADSDYRLYIRSTTYANRQKAMEAQSSKILYQNRVHDLETIRKKLLESIDEALKGYPDDWATVWKLYYLKPHSIEDIAEKTNYSVNSIRKILARMKKDGTEKENDNENETKTDGFNEGRGDSEIPLDPDPDNP